MNTKKIKFSCVCSLFMAMCLVFCACGGFKSSLKTYWELKEIVYEPDYQLTNYAIFKLGETSETSSDTLKEIWINSDKHTKNSVDFSLAFGYSESTQSTKVAKKTFATEQFNQDGWICILNNVKYSQNYVEISTTSAMNLYEIVFVTESDKIIEPTLVAVGERVEGTTSGNRYSLEAYTEKVTAGNLKHTALELLDEQDKFNLENVRLETKKNAELSASASVSASSSV